MQAFVVKDEITGKYVTKKDSYKPALGKLPILFASDSEAFAAADRLTEMLAAEYKCAIDEIPRWETYVKKQARKVAKAVEAELAAAETKNKRVIAVTKSERKSQEERLMSYKQQFGQRKAALRRAEKASQASIVVLEVKVP